MNQTPTPNRPARSAERLAEFLALRPGTIGVLGMIILVGMGEQMAERFLPIYILALGGSALAVGLLQAMGTLLSALYSFAGGYLSDRLGAKRSLLIFNLVAMAGFTLVILIPTWQAVLVGAVLFISWSAISMPATMSLMYAILPRNKRTMGVTMDAIVRRIPMALGPILGGVFIAVWGETDGIRLAFVAALILAGAALVLQQRMIPDIPAQWKSPEKTSDKTSGKTSGVCELVPEKNPILLYRRMPRDMKDLLVSDILIRFCEQIPFAFVVVWCMQVIAEPVSAIQFGLLTSIEMATAVLVYIPVAYMADRTAKKPFITATFVFFTLFPLVLMHSQSFTWLLGAFVLRGLQEFGEPARKALIMDLAPEDCRAGMFGLYYLIRDVFVSAAALGGAFLWMISPQLNLWTAFCFGVFGTVWFILFGRETRRG